MKSGRLLLVIGLFWALSAQSQGINFENQKSWAEMQEMAKNQHKYIFVDIGATWCVPCYLMDKNVFKKRDVGDFYNAKFLNYKVQADSTKADSQEIKDRYADAKAIVSAYNVRSYPTFLFISPNGNLVVHEFGSLNADKFISLAQSALAAPDVKTRTFAETMDAYNQNQLTPVEIRDFALLLLKQGDAKRGYGVAQNYKNNYLDTASEEVLGDSANLRLIYCFPGMIKEGDNYFNFLAKHGGLLDKVANEQGYANRAVNSIIVKAEVRNKIYTDNKPIESTPDWDGMKKNIASKFSEKRATSIMAHEKYIWYAAKKDWANAVKFGIEYITTPSLDTTEFGCNVINNFVSDMLVHSEDPAQLNEALTWMDAVIKARPDYFDAYDTRSELLYKLGRKKDAIASQKEAMRKIRHAKPSNKDQLLYALKENLDKMRADKLSFDESR